MMGKTHMIGGALSGMAVISMFGTKDVVEIGTIMGTGVLGSLVPDLDHPKSKLSTANPITKLISLVICSFTSHRRATHTVWFSIIIGVAGYFITLGLLPIIIGLINVIPIDFGKVSYSHWAMIVGIGMLAGAISHIVFDTFNKEGIMWLHPFSKKRISIMPITTSSTGETIFATIVSMILLVWIVLSIGYGNLETLKIFKIW